MRDLSRFGMKQLATRSGIPGQGSEYSSFYEEM
jgi:hypothetical protein